MKSLRSWFTEERASEATDYTSQLIAKSILAARGIDGIKSIGAYRGSLTLIGAAAGVATLTGRHSDALQPHLSTIARSMVDTGQSDWLINVGGTGEVSLLPVTTTVVGGPDPRTWVYQATMPGPSETVTLQRSGEAVLSFRLRTDPKSPWRGRPAIDSSGTSNLLCLLEGQMELEARVSPARLITGGAVSEQAGDISDTIKAGGIVSVLQAGATASITDPSGLKAGAIRNEVSAPSVSLHTKLSTLICGAMGVPADLVMGSSSEQGSRESFRRFAATTINNILVTVAREWTDKLGTELQWDTDQLRSSDDVSRARATGSRAQAVSRLVDSGLPLNQAMAVVGID